jgi:protease II
MPMTGPAREAGHDAAGGVAVKPPVAARRPQASVHHHQRRTDDYAWLRADNWQKVMRDPSVLAADIRAYLEAENAYAATAMADVEGLRLDLFGEMRGRIKEDDSTVPAPDGPYAYASRYMHGAEHPRIVRTPRDGGDETVLLDADAMAAGKAYFRLGGVAHSPDHRRLAYATDDSGNGHMARLERENGLPRIVVTDTATGEEHAIAFDEEAYSLGLSAGYEFDTTTMRFTYSSMTTPRRSTTTTWRPASGPAQDAGGAVRPRPADYVTRRILAPAADGETVPVSLLYRKDTPLDGSAPLPALRLRRLRHYHPGGVSTTCLCRWSTAASSTPSPMCAAARTRATAGTRTGGAKTSQHLHRLHRRRRHLAASGSPRAAGSSPWGGSRPAAC